MRPPSGSSKKAAQSSRRIASICSGAFVLAEAGLLNGRRATMHWAHAASFRARFPDVQTEEDRIFIKDGPVWTSAGMTAGIDLVLALIDNDLGPDTAKLVARLLVMHERRLGGQKQHSALLDMTPRSDRIELVLAHIRQNLRNPLTIDELAAVANLSPRQFSRAFLARPVNHRQKPSSSCGWRRPGSCWRKDGTRSASSPETGFSHRERMRRTFVRAFGVPPEALRRPRRERAEATKNSDSFRSQ